MRKKIVALFAVLLVSVGIAHAQTLPPEITTCDQLITSIIYGEGNYSPAGERFRPSGGESHGGIQSLPDGLSISDAEAIYLDEHGHYWQGLRTHSQIPDFYNPQSPNLAIHPIDQAESWNDMGLAIPGVLEFAIKVDVYDGPNGQGYTVTSETIIGGVRYKRVVNIGPESYRDLEWKPMPFISPLP